jgi:hypothetical protein
LGSIADNKVYTPAELSRGDVVAFDGDSSDIRLVTEHCLFDLYGNQTAGKTDSFRSYTKLPTGHKTTLTVTREVPEVDLGKLFTPAELSIGDLVSIWRRQNFANIRLVTPRSLIDLRGYWHAFKNDDSTNMRIYTKLPTGFSITLEVA